MRPTTMSASKYARTIAVDRFANGLAESVTRAIPKAQINPNSCSGVAGQLPLAFFSLMRAALPTFSLR